MLTQVLYKTASGAVGKSVEYEYDPFDRLVRRTADADGVRPGAPETTYYVYDGTEIVLALDATGAVANRYLWAPDVDLILADEQPTGVIWPLADNQGTIRDLAQYDAATGNTTLANRRTYDSFGDLKFWPMVLSKACTTTNSWTATGIWISGFRLSGATDEPPV